ncbi:DeoR family transcriptional regulator [Lactobacillus sp. R2/2]|nr:DeoR family transcriptional regulator [Lactobacillus sp. R2/2]
MQKLNVSRETIRGDLSVLQDQGKVTLIRGGAILIVSKDETPYEKRLDFMVAEKTKLLSHFVIVLKKGIRFIWTSVPRPCS